MMSPKNRRLEFLNNSRAHLQTRQGFFHPLRHRQAGACKPQSSHGPYNPATGEANKIPAKKVVTFHIAKATKDAILLVHGREVFRLAVTTSASAIILMQCHPSWDSSPSDADIRVTRDLIRAGQILKIEVLDHVIMGHGNFSSLKALGYFL